MPSISDVSDSLDNIITRKDPEKAEKDMVTYDLQGEEKSPVIDAWRRSRMEPNSKMSTRVQNRIFDYVRDTIPVSEEKNDITTFKRRSLVKTLAETPEEGLKLLQENTSLPARLNPDSGVLEVEWEGEVGWTPIDDPDDYNIFDIPDVIPEVLEALAVGATTAAGGPLAGMTTEAVIDLSKQRTREIYGIQEGIDYGRTALRTGLAGASELTTPFLSPLSKKIQGGIADAMSLLPGRPAFNVETVKGVAKKYGLVMTPATTIESQKIVDLENWVGSLRLVPGGVVTRQRRKKALEATKEEARSWFSARGDSAYISSDNALKAIAKVIEPISSEYNRLYKEIEDDLTDEYMPTVFLESMFRRYEKIADLDPAIGTTYNKAVNYIEKWSLKDKKGNITAVGLNDIDEMSKILSSNANQAAKSGNHRAAGVLWEMSSEVKAEHSRALSDLVNAQQIKPEVRKKIKKATSLYRDAKNKIRIAFGEADAKLKREPLNHVKDLIEKNKENPISLINQAANMKNPERLKELKNTFPEAFQELREFRLSQLFDKRGVRPTFVKPDGTFEINTQALLKELRSSKMEPETAAVLFGEDFKDNVTVFADIAEKVLPRGKASIPTVGGLIKWILYDVPLSVAASGVLKGADFRAGLERSLRNSIEETTDRNMQKIFGGLYTPGTAFRAATFGGLSEAMKQVEQGLTIPGRGGSRGRDF